MLSIEDQLRQLPVEVRAGLRKHLEEIDRVPSSGSGTPLDTDQRHGIRQDRCDMGAFELGALGVPIFEDGFEYGSTSAWSSSVP